MKLCVLHGCIVSTSVTRKLEEEHLALRINVWFIEGIHHTDHKIMINWI